MDETQTTQPTPDNLIDAEAPPIPKPVVSNVEVKTAKPPEVLTADENQSDQQLGVEEQRELIRKHQQKIERRYGVESFLRIKNTGVLSNEEIIEATKDWSETVGLSEQNLAETLKYLDLTESMFASDFPPERKIKIVCALAERIADGTFDAETLQAMVFKVIKRKTAGGPNRVADYSRDFPMIGVHEELFEVGSDGELKNNVDWILNHELAHPLDIHGGLGQDDELQGAIGKQVSDVGNLRNRESYRSINMIDQYLSAADEEKEQLLKSLGEELLAEKVAAYLQSGSEFAEYIRALLEVIPKENRQNLMKDKLVLNAWTEENKFFFDKIKILMADKSAMKEKILASTAKTRAQISSQPDDFDFDTDEFFGNSFVESQVPDTSKSAKNSEEEGFFKSIFSGLIDLYRSAEPDISAVTPIEEINKAT
ncbi:MAG: hypothetical protein NTY30_00695 [Candidatus Berkelbacteria bacterium]|nr:hypothetical protein [Candidatus Berkelbacteria bacterium]